MSHKDGASALEGLESNALNDICHRIPKEAPNNFGFRNEFRTIDGKGNNLDHPNRGRANTPFSRILRAKYDNRISSPRKSGLPNARLVSKLVFNQKDLPSSKLSHLVMIWGQFLDHDITLAAQPNTDCSNTCVSTSGECFGISIKKPDTPFNGRSCIELKRDVPACQSDVKHNRREQINTVSSFIDGSGVYSNKGNKFNSLRDLNRPGLLIEMRNPNRGQKNLLTRQEEGFCRSKNEYKKPCFRAGDERVNENSGLASMHTVWNREHNRIAKILRRINRHWGSNKLFFETRKIIGAMIQHITYNEFLPVILARNVRRKFGLVLQSRNFFWGYNRRIDPSIKNSFAAAAYRFGHSLIQNQYNRFNRFNKKKSPIQMNRFFDTSFLYQYGGVDLILRGLVKDKAQKSDGSFVKAVHEQLRRGPGDLADLPALNIQRGREHGLPGYIEFRNKAIPYVTSKRYRKRKGLRLKATSFDHLKSLITNSQIKTLKRVYKKVSHIDLFVGGILEKPWENGSVGPTFSVLIADQFRRLRKGDRFWYENPGQFTLAQLEEIRKTSLARVICDNSDGIQWTNKWALRRRSRIRCSSRRLKRVNFDKWKTLRYY